jgi:hypothetical protein
MAKATSAITLALCAAAGISCGGSPAAPAQPLNVTTLLNFNAAEKVFPAQTFQVVRDQATWQTLWAKLNADDSPPRALPAVDFSTDMVVVAAAGPEPTAGFRVSVDSASERAGAVTVEVTITSPGPTCGLLTIYTSPVATARLPTRAGPVNFDVTPQVGCGG